MLADRQNPHRPAALAENPVPAGVPGVFPDAGVGKARVLQGPEGVGQAGETEVQNVVVAEPAGGHAGLPQKLRQPGRRAEIGPQLLDGGGLVGQGTFQIDENLVRGAEQGRYAAQEFPGGERLPPGADGGGNADVAAKGQAHGKSSFLTAVHFFVKGPAFLAVEPVAPLADKQAAVSGAPGLPE